MKDERKLAAIVFTDIVGYTSIMEKNEEEALNILKKHITQKKQLYYYFMN